jgi:uncharacterized protein (TIGR02996 family)
VIDPLVDAMIATPDDDAPRLVWADREGGARGELVVVQCALAARDLPREERKRLADRERFLLRVGRTRWDRLDGLATDVRYRRGFIESARVTLAILATRADELFARAPCLRAIDIEAPGYVSERDNRGEENVWRDLTALHASAYAALPRDRVRELRTSTAQSDTEEAARWFAGDLVEILASAPALARLEWLAVGHVLFAPEPLAALPALTRLEGDFDPVRALRALPQLSRVALHQPAQLHGDALAALLAAPDAIRLVELDLADNGVRIADVRRIAEAPVLPRLERLAFDEELDFGRSRLPHETIATLARSPYLGALVDLDLRCQTLVASSLAVLAAAPFAPQLRALRLARFDDDVAAATLIDAFPSLVSLHVRVPPDDVDVLRAAIPQVTP